MTITVPGVHEGGGVLRLRDKDRSSVDGLGLVVMETRDPRSSARLQR